MAEQDQKIQELEDRLDRLVRTQIDFQKEITAIRGELVRLHARRVVSDQQRANQSFYVPTERPTTPTQRPVSQTPPSPPSQTPPRADEGGDVLPRPPVRPPVSSSDTGYELPKRTPYVPDPVLSDATVSGDPFSRFAAKYTENARANLEEFIGKNLISLIGIVVLILGVGIGAKYAIDNNLISPLTRIIIGYVFGFGLVGFAIKLRRSYLNFSAVLFSGGMAIMYFVTYFAYSAYGLLSQLGAFGLMLMFTAVTVAAALLYSRQVIAHIGLVGAYAVPFLLSNDSGNYLALFIYMAVINTGILAVSLKKKWTPIFYTSSLFTWAIFVGWFFTKYSPQEHFQLALIFLAVFIAILYGTRVAELKLFDEDADATENLIASTVTAAIFYAMCFAIVLTGPLQATQYWTFFTYLTVASLAIIAVSLKFYRPLAVLMAALSMWVIFCGWFANKSWGEYFELALVFLSIFFVISYGATLIQTRLLDDEKDRMANMVASVLTCVIFYVLCFAMIQDPVVEAPAYWTLFTYLAVASILILGTSFKFFNRVLMYVVVPAVWAIYAGWFFLRYDAAQHFDLAAVFAALFFAIFYFSILFHRLVEDNFTLVEHTSLVLANAFTFYGFGYSVMDGRETLRDYLGLYTVANAVLHLVVALALRRLKPKAVDVVQVLTVLILTFASIAVPVQFDGNLVTMIWAVEGAVLFWYGRTRGVRLFEKFSYPVMFLATVSLGLEWAVVAGDRVKGVANAVQPFVNSDFVTAAVYVAAFALIYITNRNSQHEPAIGKDLVRPFGIAIAIAGCVVLYNMFRMEIGNYFFLASTGARSAFAPTVNGVVGDLQWFNVAWQINYTLFFLTAMAVFNLKRFRSTSLALANGALAVMALGVFGTVSMFLFNDLRTAYVAGRFNPDLVSHWMYIAIRPMSYALAAGLIYMVYEYRRDSLLKDRIDAKALRYGFDAIAYTLVFVVASCELINLMGQFGIPDGTKLGLSILWGIYALVLIMIGIGQDKKHLRIAAMVLLGVTLAKLFFYDIADLDTIPKTILFVTLGITLLLISFLYNKYKGVMFKTDAAQED